MIHYETLILVCTESTAEEISSLENKIEEKINDAKGIMSSFDHWGKYRLAYPVKKNDYGFYILSRYEIPKDSCTKLFKELDNMFKIKFNEVVMRHISVKLEKDAPAVYAKPDPIEGGKAGNLDAFLKENKMEGLISDNAKTAQEKVEKKAGESLATEKAEVSEPSEQKISEKTEKQEAVSEKEIEENNKDDKQENQGA